MQQNKMKIIVVGASGVGKTTFINYIHRNEVVKNATTTIGADIVQKPFSYKGQNYTLQLWDTAGQEKFKTITATNLRGYAGCLVMFSLESKSSFQELEYWISAAQRYKSEVSQILIVGNKGDLSLEEREVKAEDVEEFCTKYGYPYVETSVYQMRNCTRCIEILCENLSAALLKQNEISIPTVQGQLIMEKPTAGKGCC